MPRIALCVLTLHYLHASDKDLVLQVQVFNYVYKKTKCLNAVNSGTRALQRVMLYTFPAWSSNVDEKALFSSICC